MKHLTLLRSALKVNGFFSLTSAFIALLFGNSVIAVSEMVNHHPLSFAIALSLFGLVVLFAGFKKKMSMALVWTIIVLDFMYVLLGFVSLVLPNNLSTGGFLLVLGTNVAVLILAVFQTIGIVGYSRSVKKLET
ncbi:hypothetical protein [Spongiimicrobium salis]|uniref:hypothetical protein n=1 Tax=Spongiimicrobium salis TaxID=1667022 RepID=UPI00374DA812